MLMLDKNQNLRAETIYYVYVLLDPRNNQPFYVGKGNKDRVNRHYYNWSSVDKSNPHKSNKIKKLKLLGYQPTYEIVFESVDEQLVYAKEKELIANWGRICFEEQGILTNINPGGEGNTGGQRAVKQYNLFGEYIQTFSSCLEAAQSLGKKNPSSIIGCCKKRGGQKAAYGYFWSYEEEDLDLTWCFGGKKKPVYQWDLQGNFVNRFVNAYQAAYELKQNCASEIKKCIKTKFNTCLNFQWTSVNVSPGVYSKPPRKNSKLVLQFTLDGTFVKRHESIYKANVSLNKRGQDNEISKAIKYSKGIAYGYEWKLG